jgi:hypothetical protein
LARGVTWHIGLDSVSVLFLSQTWEKTPYRWFEIHSVLLPICTVATAVRAMCNCCGRDFRCDSNPHAQYFKLHWYLRSWALLEKPPIV